MIPTEGIDSNYWKLHLILTVFISSCLLKCVERFHDTKLNEFIKTIFLQNARITAELRSGQFAKGKWQWKDIAIKALIDNALKEDTQVPTRASHFWSAQKIPS